MRHVIVTRYGLGNSDPVWYRNRISLFKRYLQSLQRQTNRNFSVLLLIDDETPEESIAECKALLPDDRFSLSKRGLKESFLEPVVQTRMDSDDIVANDFVETIQHHIELGGMVNFENGYIELNGKFYRIRYTSNMFLSIWSTESCYAREHTLMYKKYPVKNITGKSMWAHAEHSGSWTWAEYGRSSIPFSRFLMKHVLWRRPYKHLAFFPSVPDKRFMWE